MVSALSPVESRAESADGRSGVTTEEALRTVPRPPALLARVLQYVPDDAVDAAGMERSADMNPRRITLLALAGLLLCAPALAAEPRDPESGDRRPPRREGRAGEAGSLTLEQQQAVKAILSRYDAATLTAADARAIHDAFRQAGLRGGPALGDVLKAAGFDPDRLRDLAPPPGSGRGGSPLRADDGAGSRGQASRSQGSRGQGRYSIEQAVSDRAQLTTIAFDGLAFLTGDFALDTFLPPGKVSDYFGFQYMRDVDANGGGHNTSFLTRIANNLLAVLTDDQKAQLLTLAREQEADLRRFALLRLPLIQAFRRNLAGDLPAGSRGLSRTAVVAWSSDLYELDGRLAFQRAKVMARVARSLDATQKAALAELAFGDSRTWPDVPDQLDRKSMPHTVNVAMMTYASEMFSWIAGSLEADTYFCPERHGMYFGGFGMKTAPAMGKRNHSISTSLTGDRGQAFLAALTPEQRQRITSLVDLQRADLAAIVETRRAIATELRRFLDGGVADKGKVAMLSRRYGELDGELSYRYATAFAAVGRTLSVAQRTTLAALRGSDVAERKGPFLYSDPIPLPPIEDTDAFFGAR